MKNYHILGLSILGLLLSSCSFNEPQEEKIYFDVNFFNDDKTTLLYESKVEKGAEAIYNGTTPTKDSKEDGKVYTFSGWDKSLKNIQANTSFYAKYDEKTLEYTCVFNNYDNTLLYSTVVKHGEDVVYEGEKPTKASQGEEIYNFVGWDKSLENIKENTTFTALYTVDKESYNVTFCNYDGTKLYQTEVLKGKTAVYLGKTPTKPQTEKNKYTFKGWDKPLTNIIQDITFTAQYDELLREFVCNFYDGDNVTILQSISVKYGMNALYSGVSPSKTLNGNTYTFSGWDKPLIGIKKDTNFYPLFNEEVASFSVDFYKDSTLSELLYTSIVGYGEDATFVGETPTKASTEYYSYVFSGWSESILAVKKNLKVYPKFSEVQIKDNRTVVAPTATTMGYTSIEPISGSEYKTNYTYVPLKYSTNYGFEYLGTLTNPDVYQLFYCQIWEACAKLDASSANITTSIQQSGTKFYTLQAIKYNMYSSFTYDAAFLSEVLTVFRNDNPREFYILTSYFYSSRSISIAIDNDYVLGADRNRYFLAIDNYINGVITTVGSKKDEALGRAIYDKIIADIDYSPNENIDLTYNHNVVGIATGISAVCEGYALMYSLASIAVGLETIFFVGSGVSGGNSGGHAWNASKFGSTWYWLDATWGDGASDPASWFKVQDSSFSSSHIIESLSNGGSFNYFPTPSPIY